MQNRRYIALGESTPQQGKEYTSSINSKKLHVRYTGVMHYLSECKNYKDVRVIFINWYFFKSYEYLRFKNPESGRIYTQNMAGSFISDANTMEITLALEDGDPSFYINYHAVEKASPKPIAIKLEDGDVSWNRARAVCQDKSLELCSWVVMYAECS